MQRRSFLLSTSAGLSAAILWNNRSWGDDTNPQSVEQLWADFDPRKDPLEIEVIRQWTETESRTFKHVRFLIGHFRGVPAYLAAIYGYPVGRSKIPGVMHIHGGGQRASFDEVNFLVGRGYAAISINWGGSSTGKPPINSPDGFQQNDANTDWGAVDPTQANVPGYHSILPGPKQFFDDREHPKNCNWYLLTIACRRGLTFLEQQPEVDSTRLGVHGYSMGGNLTMYVAGTDDRVKVAVPAVGGQGWRTETHQFLGGVDQQEHIRGDVETFRKTLSFENYASRIQCPVLHRSSTNDFHGWMDDVYRTNERIPHKAVRYSWSPHFNHRLTPEVAVTLPLWLDQHLLDGNALPDTPASQLELKTPDQVPSLNIKIADHAWPIKRVEMFYSIDPDPRARFWRSVNVTLNSDNQYTGALPLHSLDYPLFSFANVYYSLPHAIDMSALRGFAKPVDEVCISSLLHYISSEQLRQNKCNTSAVASPIIDDFSEGLRDWYLLNAGNLTHQQTWTRKITDPLYRGTKESKLKVTFKLSQPNTIVIILRENEWRSYRGPRKTYVCSKDLQGSENEQVMILDKSDFLSDSNPLPTWEQIDQIGFAHYDDSVVSRQQVEIWKGDALSLRRLEWLTAGD
jgi:hypothetical protein